MNDRFKFRVWDKKSNNYIKVKMFYIDKFGELFKYEQSKSTVYINAPSPYVMCLCGDNYIVEQCTGLKDKNGKLIYEGDILNSLYRSDGCEGLYRIVWCEGRLLPEKFGNHQQKQVTVHLTNLKWCEVIGNIHENADLLGNEE